MRRALRVAAVAAAAVLCGAQTLHAQFYQPLGPRLLYPRAANDTPLVVRDAVRSISLGTRLIEPGPRIMGGHPTPNGVYPWMASVGLKGIAPRAGHFCGGTFVAADWVLTAAHCVKSGTATDAFSANSIQVYGGSNRLDSGGSVYPVDRIVVHEKYDGNTNDDDVALLHLGATFPGPPLRLLTAADADRLADAGRLAVVIGWGLTGEGLEVSNVLHHVTVQIAATKVCNSLAAYGGAVTDTMVCAGLAEGGHDSCQGDSGGPLVVADGQGGYFQAGIVSWGEGCARPMKLGVYTRVSMIQPWVADHIGGQRTPVATGPPAPTPAATPATTAAPAGPPVPQNGQKFAPRQRSAAAEPRTSQTAANGPAPLQELGPVTLYPRRGAAAEGAEPLVVRDARQFLATRTRLLDPKPRIMGGEPAQAGAYPWIASLVVKGSDTRDGHFCGGAFIAADWVVTAAHCLHGESAGRIEVHGGSNQLSSGGSIYPADRIIVHENYDNGTQENDVALVHLAARFSGPTSRLLTAADADRYAAAGSTAIAIGWGLTAEGTEVSNILRQVPLQIVSNAACNGPAAYGAGITDGMLCAGFAAGGKDACQGDSGGPLVVSDRAGGYFQAGIVSWGEGCGRPNKFGVYTRVSKYQAWIADKIGSRSAVPVAEKTNSRARTAVADTKPAAPSPLAQSIPLPPPRPGNIARTRAPTAAPSEPARKAHTTRDARLAARQSRPTYRSLPAWADEIRRNFVVRTPPE